MLIIAKFTSVCPHCTLGISVGEKVEWTKGSMAMHAACAANGAVKVKCTTYARRIPPPKTPKS